MGVPNVKVIMSLQYGDIGWQEGHYLPAVLSLTKSVLDPIGKDLAAARVKCLDGLNGKLTDVKFSVDNVNRDTYHLPSSLLPTKTASGYFPGSTVSASNTVVWTWQSPQLSWPALLTTDVAGVFGDEYIAGMPANIGQSGPGPIDSVGQVVATALSAYFDVLTNNNYGMKYRAWPAGPQMPGNSVMLTANPTFIPATASTPNQLKFQVANWGTFTQPVKGQFIRLAGQTYTTPIKRARYNGSYSVVSADATSVTVGAPRITVGPTWGQTGYIQVSDEGVTPYTAYTLRNITHKKRGRPTSVPRGHR